VRGKDLQHRASLAATDLGDRQGDTVAFHCEGAKQPDPQPRLLGCLVGGHGDQLTSTRQAVVDPFAAVHGHKRVTRAPRTLSTMYLSVAGLLQNSSSSRA
jgi:hypothetical protein